MLSRYSVKKPYTVLVAVVLVLVLGVISFMNMTTDLLPSIELPYVVVMTTYPGASPEKIEATVTRPLESVLGTTGGIKNVSSISSENASVIILEFEQGTNMDSAMIELSGNIDLVSGQLDDMVGTPMLLKISPDMLPVMVASVDMDGMDVKQISAFTDDTVVPAFERLDGVASVDETGLVSEQVTVTLSQEKIDALNARVLKSVDSGLWEAQQELNDGLASLANGKAQLADGEAAIASQKDEALDQMAQGSAQLDSASATLSALLSEETTLNANKAAFEAEKAGYEQAQQGYAQLNAGLAAAKSAAQQQVNDAEQVIVEKANQMLQMTGQTVSSIEEVDKAIKDLKDMGMDALIPEDLAAAVTAAVEGKQNVASMPGSVSDLLALTPAAFETFKAQAGAMPGGDAFANLTQDSLKQLKEAAEKAPARIPEIETELNNISTRMAVITAMKPQLESGLRQAQDAYAALEEGKLTAVSELTKGEITLENTKAKLEEAEQQLEDAQKQFDEARDAAYKRADISGVLTMDMVGNILMAQNFNMPAGYIIEQDEQYLVKVGDTFSTVDQLRQLLLLHLDADDIGDIYLSDVADIAVTDNAAESYARVNGNDGVVLSFQKQSTASTADVSERINDAIAALEKANPGLHITPLMDQGDYIEMVVDSVLSNLLWGGLLAIVVLILFLKDAKPTLIVACSIPFSLMCAITLMYFSNVTLNIISLSGLALGVGMLVDNSIVVIENIYRLRSEGVPAAKAAVEGARQVAGAIFASTLTTVCVFLPIVFTEGISRQLFTDMGLTIAYALLASLVVALTLVPAMGASVLRNTKEQSHKWFDAMVGGYRRLLAWSLRHKAAVLALALALLVLSVFLTTQMGTAFIPAMDSPQMSASMTAPQGTSQEDLYALADTVAERIAAVDGVETVGAMAGGSGMSALMGGGSSGGGSITYYVLLADNRSATNTQVAEAVNDAVADLDCTVSVEESTMDMSALGGSGVELVITGRDLDVMNGIAGDLRDILRGTEGLTDISEGRVTDNPETRITVDKYKAMQHGLTVAQVYAEIASALKEENTATTLTLEGSDLPVVVVRPEGASPTRDTIMDHAFITTSLAGEEETVYLRDIAAKSETDSVASIRRENGVRTMSVTAAVDAQHNIGLVSREISRALADYTLPEGYTV
ncbi:MAG: MMPL family transporter, partial [Subdoligranulum sp.]|nr:MMPL family transporter [Subdoligranulum sp.]